MGAAARVRYGDWHSTPEQLARRDAGARRGSGRRHRPLSMRLVFVTQTVDADHPVLAQTVDLVRALAARCESVDRPLRLRRPARPARRTSGSAPSARGNASAAGSGSRGRSPRLGAPAATRPDAVLVHMVPLFVAARGAAREGAARSRCCSGTRTGTPSRSLRLALAAGRRRPQRQPRLVPARDAEAARDRARDRRRPLRTPPEDAPADGPLRLLALGRTARWKGYDTMLEALELATERGLDAQLEIRGPQLTDDERAHRRELEATVAASHDAARPGPDRAAARARRDPGAARGPPMRSSARPSRARARRSTRSSTRPPPAGCR